MSSNKCAFSCMSHATLICSLSSAFFVTSKAPPTMAYNSTGHPPRNSSHTRMRTGPVALTRGNPHRVFVSSLVPISYLGHPNDRPPCLVLVRRPSIVPWHTVWPNLVGYGNFSPSSGDPPHAPPSSIATMSVRCISRPTPCNINGRNNRLAQWNRCETHSTIRLLYWQMLVLGRI